MNNKLLSMFILSIVLISCASATIESLPPIKQNTNISILQVVSNMSSCNLTSVRFPDSSVAVSNVPMSKSDIEYTYTFTNTSLIGIYVVNGVCDNETNQGTFSYNFEVTPNGLAQSTSQGINSLGFLGLMIFLTIALGILGYFLFNHKYLWILGLFFIFLMFLFIVYDVWLGYEFHRMLTGINDGSIMPEIMFYLFMFLLVAGLVISGILLFTHWKDLLKWYKQSKSEYKQEQENDINFIDE